MYLCGVAKVWNPLNAVILAPINSAAFVTQLIHTTGRLTAGVVLIPTTCMKGMPFKITQTRQARQFRSVERTAGHDHMACGDNVTTIGGHRPFAGLIIPPHFADTGLQQRARVKVIVFCHTLRMFIYFRYRLVFLFRHISGFFHQR